MRSAATGATSTPAPDPNGGPTPAICGIRTSAPRLPPLWPQLPLGTRTSQPVGTVGSRALHTKPPIKSTGGSTERLCVLSAVGEVRTARTPRPGRQNEILPCSAAGAATMHSRNQLRSNGAGRKKETAQARLAARREPSGTLTATVQQLPDETIGRLRAVGKRDVLGAITAMQHASAAYPLDLPVVIGCPVIAGIADRHTLLRHRGE